MQTIRRDDGAPFSGASRPRSGLDGADALVSGLPDLDVAKLHLVWRNHLGGTAPAHLPRWLLVRVLAYRVQTSAYGDLDRATLRRIRALGSRNSKTTSFNAREPATREGIALKPGALLVREWNGQLHRAMILEHGFAWNATTYSSLSQVAKAITGTNWNGHRFFGLRKAAGAGLANASDGQ
jgi:hypothetical protein